MNYIYVQGRVGQQFLNSLNSLNCYWIVSGSWKVLEIMSFYIEDLFLKCSRILLYKFHKSLYSSFSWFIFLKLMPLYRFQLLFDDAKTSRILFLLIFVFHEICLWLLWHSAFLKKPSNQLLNFQRRSCFWKILICSLNVLDLFLDLHC